MLIPGGPSKTGARVWLLGTNPSTLKRRNRLQGLEQDTVEVFMLINEQNGLLGDKNKQLPVN